MAKLCQQGVGDGKAGECSTFDARRAEAVAAQEERWHACRTQVGFRVEDGGQGVAPALDFGGTQAGRYPPSAVRATVRVLRGTRR